MTILRKSISLLALFSIVPAAWAVTMRPSAISTTTGALTATAVNGASRRLPVSTGYRLLSGNVVGTATTSSSSSVASLDDVECVEEYTSCITGDDACGSDFEECTTNVLFHAQMTDCTSTLMQCTPNGIANLFGINNINNLSAAASTDEDGRITEFVYPTADSVMGQKIIAAEIDNRYSTEQCARNYTRCLERDDVCGANFELCTNAKEFKRQALYCDSKLARCQVEGVKHMFGTAKRYATVDDLKESEVKSGVIHDRIAAGADYVANNALDTCYKVVDNCFAKACTANPFRCLEGTSVGKLKSAQMVSDGGNSGEIELNNLYGGDETAKLNGSQINRYLRTSCADTIGLNESCQMIVNGKKATAKQLKDQDEKEDIIDTVYASMYNDRLSRIQSIVQGLAQEFDSSAKTECIETIQECAIRSCGGGSGSACYTKVMSGKGENKSIAGGDAYEDIKTGCTAVVNTNPYCLYAKSAAGESDSTVYSYSFTADDAFSTLFPDHSNGTNAGDPIGAVATINAALFSTYNEAGLANMKRACQQTATECVKSVCGSDYSKCYLSTINTGTKSESSITGIEVGGVLDYTIVLGRCIGAVKADKNCDEHRAIAQLGLEKTNQDVVNSWGDSTSVRNAWNSVGGQLMDNGAPYAADKTLYMVARDEYNREICTVDGMECPCGQPKKLDTGEEIYCSSTNKKYVTYSDQAANNLFYELIADMNAEAQGFYRSKKLQQQRMCLDMNSVGGNSAQRIYRWISDVKLNKQVRIRAGGESSDAGRSSYYSTGINVEDMQGRDTDDLYNGYCAVRVTLGSDDPLIRDALKGALANVSEKRLGTGNHEYTVNKDDLLDLEDVRYFAVGDAFACGTWLTQSQLEAIAKVVENKAREEKEAGQATEMRAWAPIIGALGLGTAGTFLGDAIQKGDIFSKQTGTTNKESKLKDAAKKCNSYISSAKSGVSKTSKSTTYKSYVENAFNLMTKYGVSHTDDSYTDAIDVYEAAIEEYLKNTDVEDNKKAASAAADKLKEEIKVFEPLCNSIEDQESKSCEKGYKWSDEEDECVPEKGKWLDRHGGQLFGGLISAGAGAGLAYAITDNVLNSELDAAGQAAYKEFMDAIGSKIHCYIGSERVASYGQMIETSME